MTYMVGKTRAIYVTDWEHMGVKFKIHRPVDRDGVIVREGWQFSIDGVPITRSEQPTKQKAISSFKRKLKRYKLSTDLFVEYVEKIKKLNAVDYPPCSDQLL